MTKKSVNDGVNRLFLDLNQEKESPVGETSAVPAATEEIKAQDNGGAAHKNNKNPICPYLKVYWDETITYGFPDEGNYCYRPKKAQAVSLNQQETVCLHGQFQDCPVYNQTHAEDLLPLEIRPQIPAGKWKTILFIPIAPILILFMGAAILMIYIK